MIWRFSELWSFKGPPWCLVWARYPMGSKGWSMYIFLLKSQFFIQNFAPSKIFRFTFHEGNIFLLIQLLMQVWLRVLCIYIAMSFLRPTILNYWTCWWKKSVSTYLPIIENVYEKCVYLPLYHGHKLQVIRYFLENSNILDL